MLVPSPHSIGGRTDDHVTYYSALINIPKDKNLTTRALFGWDHSGIARVSGMLGLSDK